MAHAGPGAGCVQGWNGPLLGGTHQFPCGFCNCCGVAVAIIVAVAALPLLLLGWLHVFLKELTSPNQTPIQKELTKRAKERERDAHPVGVVTACKCRGKWHASQQAPGCKHSPSNLETVLCPTFSSATVHKTSVQTSK